jgi:NitT/TauT family transport system substrate-binding protein
VRPKRITLVIAIMVLLAAGTAIVQLKGCTQKPVPLETVRIGAVTQGLGGLIYIADERGFFKRRGINVAIEKYDAGVIAVNALLADTVDVAVAAEFVMVQKGFDHRDLRTFGQIADARTIGIVARRDHGIEKPADLKGKRIGLTRGSVSEFFLGRFLERERVPLSGVRLVDLASMSAEVALSDGSVDALMLWEPNLGRMEKRLGENGVSWPIQGRDNFYVLLVTKERFLRNSPLAAEKMLRALIDAEDFVAKHPEEAPRIIDRRAGTRPGDAQLALAKCTLTVRLDQSLLTLMEAEEHWMIRNHLTASKEMPNYFDMIYLKALETVKPEAVRIIH